MDGGKRKSEGERRMKVKVEKMERKREGMEVRFSGRQENQKVKRKGVK